MGIAARLAVFFFGTVPGQNKADKKAEKEHLERFNKAKEASDRLLAESETGMALLRQNKAKLSV